MEVTTRRFVEEQWLPTVHSLPSKYSSAYAPKPHATSTRHPQSQSLQPLLDRMSTTTNTTTTTTTDGDMHRVKVEVKLLKKPSSDYPHPLQQTLDAPLTFHDTVATLKAQIARQFQLPPDHQRLVRKGKAITEDTQVLGELLGVKEECQSDTGLLVHVMLKPGASWSSAYQYTEHSGILTGASHSTTPSPSTTLKSTSTTATKTTTTPLTVPSTFWDNLQTFLQSQLPQRDDARRVLERFRVAYQQLVQEEKEASSMDLD